MIRHIAAGCAVLAVAPLTIAPAQADNQRLNNSVIDNVYTARKQAGCAERIIRNAQLQLAAEWHTHDLLVHRNLDTDLGSDGSTPQSRATAAGFTGTVTQTVAINHSLAINNLDILKQWYYDPVRYAIMADCSYTVMGVWSENSLDRSVVVAVYGRP